MLISGLLFVTLGPAAQADVSQLQRSEVSLCTHAEVTLEVQARQGELEQGIAQCLEQTILTAPPEEARRASYLLIADAYARGDRVRWGALTQRHLVGIDEADPDLAYRYALFLARGGPAAEPEVRRWIDVAVQHTDEWQEAPQGRRQETVDRLVDWVMRDSEA